LARECKFRLVLLRVIFILNCETGRYSSPIHRALRISLPVTFGCCILSKWAPRRYVSQPCDGRTPDHSKRGLPTMAGSMERACMQWPYIIDDCLNPTISLHTNKRDQN
jgi:hypothetical protein